MGTPLGPVSGNLPAPLTTFIGRRAEMREVVARLQRGRLVTITGVGGGGKSRLGVEAAAASTAHFPDGAWLVELASVSDPKRLEDAVNAVLRLGQDVGHAGYEPLLSRLRSRRLLLLLDNCEHLVEAVAHLVDLILATSPGVRILATSRERLGITGESVWRVPGLRFPDVVVDDLSALAGFDAVRLFVERAQDVEPEFALTTVNAGVVCAVCRLLDGLPLAIELAAARVGGRGVEVVLDEMVDPYRFLTVGSRTALPRHRTLTAVVEWSYRLLDDGQQRVFDRLSVFTGGFSVELAVAVCSEDLSADAVVEALVALVDKSLVVVESLAGGSPRYRLLETLRAFGAERLSGRGEDDTCRSRHALVMLSLAEGAWQSLRGSRQREWLERLEVEHGNLRAALGYLLERGDGAAAQALAGALTPFWDLHGHYGEGREWLSQSLDFVTPTTSQRVRAMNGVAELTLIQGDFGLAVRLFEEAAVHAEECGDEKGAAYSLQFLGLAAIYVEDHPKAEHLLAQAATASVQSGDEWLMGWTGIFQCALELQRDNVTRAEQIGIDARRHLESVGEPEGLAWTAIGLGAADWCSGDLRSAQRWISEGLRGFWELGGSWGISMALSMSAQWACSMERTDTGVALLAASESLRQSVDVALLPFMARWQELTVERTRLSAGHARFEEIWTEAAAWSVDESVRCALEMFDVASVTALPPNRPTATPGRVAAAPQEPTLRKGVFRRAGDYWTVALDGPAFQMSHTVGMAHLARLLAAPGAEIPALALAAGRGTEHLSDGGSSMSVLDAAAKKDYRRKLHGLAAELDEAERWADFGRAEQLRVEIDTLTNELVAATGLGGRARTVSTEAERARVNVTKAIRSAIRRIAQHDADLGHHMEVSVRTGTFCSYVPDPATKIHWQS